MDSSQQSAADAYPDTPDPLEASAAARILHGMAFALSVSTGAEIFHTPAGFLVDGVTVSSPSAAEAIARCRPW